MKSVIRNMEHASSAFHLTSCTLLISYCLLHVTYQLYRNVARYISALYERYQGTDFCFFHMPYCMCIPHSILHVCFILHIAYVYFIYVLHMYFPYYFLTAPAAYNRNFSSTSQVAEARYVTSCTHIL